MDKDDTIVKDGMVEEEEEDLLDFDLDDLASEEESESGEDDEIIELVDLVVEDGESVEFEDAGDEIKMLFDDDAASHDDSSEVEAGPASDDFDSMLDEVDLDETVADIDMSDVALDLDLGLGESSGEEAGEISEGVEADLSSVLGEDSPQEVSFDFEEPAGVETPADMSGPTPEGLEAEDQGISADDLQKMLEDEGGEEFDFDLPSDEGSEAYDDAVETDSGLGDDVTEETLERMLEDETADEVAEEPVPHETPPVTGYEDTVVDSTPWPPQEGVILSEEKIAETVRTAVEEVVRRDLPQIFTDVTEQAVRGSLTGMAEQVIRESVTETADQAIRESLTDAAERVIRETLTDTAERVIRESLTDAAERVIRESVTDAAERIIRETIDALKAGLDAAGD